MNFPKANKTRWPRKSGCWNNLGPTCRFLILPMLGVRVTAKCVNFGCNKLEGHCVSCTLSILGEHPILLIGADKTGNPRFYVEYVPIADTLYDDHLRELRREGLIQ